MFEASRCIDLMIDCFDVQTHFLSMTQHFISMATPQTPIANNHIPFHFLIPPRCTSSTEPICPLSTILLLS
jgi:hypothetical protein